MCKKNMLLGITLLISLLFLPSGGYSAQWRISPLNIELGKGAKSGAVTVINEGKEKLLIQMKAYEWIQDTEGKDQYIETSDIVFFPKLAEIKGHGKRIIRVGIKIPAVLKEKTYRLFVAEIPQKTRDDETEGASVLVAIRVGVPIFVKPLKIESKIEIEKIELTHGVLNVVVKNTGNEHVALDSVVVKGKDSKGEEIFSEDLKGWYLLNGAARTYSVSVPEPSCKEIQDISVEIKTKTNKPNLHGGISVKPEMCLP